MSKIHPLTLAQFLTLTQIKWECRNNTVSRQIKDDSFVIDVVGDKPEKTFTITLPFSQPGKVFLNTTAGELAYNIDSDDKLPIESLLENLPVTPSVSKKYLESYSILGEPVRWTEGCKCEGIKTKSDSVKAFLGLAGFNELGVTTTLFNVSVKSMVGTSYFDILRISTGDDNELSGRYVIYEPKNDMVTDVELDVETLTVECKPLNDLETYIKSYSNEAVKTTDANTDFKHIIGNEKLQGTEPEPEDKSKYLYPQSEKLSIEDAVGIIIDECNNVLGMYTVPTQLDFEPEATRIAVTTAHRTWLNIVVAIKDGLLYMNYLATQSSANYQSSLRIDGLTSLASVGATANNAKLIRALINNLVLSAPVTIPMGQRPGTMGYIRQPTYGQGSAMTDQPEYAKEVRISAERFVSVVLSAFGNNPMRSGRPGEVDRLDQLDQLLHSLNLPRLTQTDVVVADAVTAPFRTNRVPLLELYNVVKAIRPELVVYGSLPSDVYI